MDAGTWRMMLPGHFEAARARPDLFDADEFDSQSPSELVKIMAPPMWGNVHRDFSARHYHYQINFWFPLHDIDAGQSLLLFPERYRRAAPLYGELPGPDDPDSWGFGRAVRIPLCKPCRHTLVASYKLSKRFDQDISAVCAGIVMEIRDGLIVDARLGYGGMAATPRRLDANLAPQPGFSHVAHRGLALVGAGPASRHECRSGPACCPGAAQCGVVGLARRRSNPKPACSCFGSGFGPVVMASRPLFI